MVTTTMQPDYSAKLQIHEVSGAWVGFRGITALGGDGGVSVFRPGDYDAAGCVRWQEEGDD